jgi:hypothetical protein
MKVKDKRKVSQAKSRESTAKDKDSWSVQQQSSQVEWSGVKSSKAK